MVDDTSENDLISGFNSNLNDTRDISNNTTLDNLTHRTDEIERIDRIKQESVNMICRQTDYSADEARIQLEMFNYDYMKVLNKYHSIEELKTPSKMLSTNQQIYGEIRNLMDTGARQFRNEQEYTKKYQEYVESRNKK